MKNIVGKTANGFEVYVIVNDEHMKAHADATNQLIAEAIQKVEYIPTFWMNSIDMVESSARTHASKSRKTTTCAGSAALAERSSPPWFSTRNRRTRATSPQVCVRTTMDSSPCSPHSPVRRLPRNPTIRISVRMSARNPRGSGALTHSAISNQ